MKVFGQDQLEIEVDCSSRLDVGNVDVMMVLDVTGSMAATVSDGGTRLDALKNAVRDFYDVLGPGGGNAGNQIRYGFMPYSATVNVGRILIDENPDWLTGGNTGQSWLYQTRQGQWEYPNPDYVAPTGGRDPNYNPTTDPNRQLVGTSSSNFTQQLRSVDGPECTGNFAANAGTIPGYWQPSNSGYPAGNPIVTINNSGAESVVTTVTFSYVSWNGSTALPPANAVGSSFWRTCVRRVTTRVDRYAFPSNPGNGEPQFLISNVWRADATRFLGWTYGQFAVDVNAYVRSLDSSNPAVQLPTAESQSPDRWNGCIEERTTVPTITTSTNSIPAAALDLDIDLLPSDAASRWGPSWTDIAYDRTSSTNGFRPVDELNETLTVENGYFACPAEARRLAEYEAYNEGSSDDLESYINGLFPIGGTNHAIGMAWGMRFLSPTGLFADTNASSGNGFSIGRHVVFMTDGLIDIRPYNVDAWGFQKLDGRLAPTDSTELQLEAIQSQRFQLLCSAAKSRGWTVWVVQFGVDTVDANMLACSSGEEFAKPATNSATLRAAFGDIAKTIGGLRLSE
jgi:hypothetical protein